MMEPIMPDKSAGPRPVPPSRTRPYFQVFVDEPTQRGVSALAGHAGMSRTRFLEVVLNRIVELADEVGYDKVARGLTEGGKLSIEAPAAPRE